MKYIRTLILAAVMVTSSAPADPPVFSQQNSWCWLASWVQLVYNLRPLIDQFLSTDRAVYTDFEVFKKTAIGKRLAQEKIFVPVLNPVIKEHELIETSALDSYKSSFTPDVSAVMDAYRELFMAMRTGVDQTTRDNRLGNLQRKLQKPKDFGLNFAIGMVPKEKWFIQHPLCNDLIKMNGIHPKSSLITGTSKSNSILEALIQTKELLEGHLEKMYWDPTPILFIVLENPEPGFNLKDSFTLDITPVVTEETKQRGLCLTYELIGLGVDMPMCHMWTFIKDQYDPAEQWWRCDTLNGNRRVTEQEIIAECTQHTPTFLTYKRSDCKGQAGAKKPLCDTKTENCNQDNRDIETLARVLWELSK